jgi:hypothetical protein
MNDENSPRDRPADVAAGHFVGQRELTRRNPA